MPLPKFSLIESAVPLRSRVSISKAADASWSMPRSFNFSVVGLTGPKAGLGRTDAISGNVCTDGMRVRGEKDGEASETCAVGCIVSGDAEAE